jgi:hypothetical protein
VCNFTSGSLNLFFNNQQGVSMSAEHFPSLVAALSKLVEVLRASAPEVTQSGPPVVIEIHDDEEEQQEHEFASETSVEHEVRTQTGPSISGEASGEMVNPSSRLPASDSLQVTAVADGGDVLPFTITEAATPAGTSNALPNAQEQVNPAVAVRVDILVGFLLACYREVNAIMATAAAPYMGHSDLSEYHQIRIHQVLIPIYAESFKQVDVTLLESNDAKRPPPPCRTPKTNEALIEYIVSNIAMGNTRVALMGAYAFLERIRCFHNELLNKLAVCFSVDKAACVIVAVLLRQRMRNNPISRAFCRKFAKSRPCNESEEEVPANQDQVEHEGLSIEAAPALVDNGVAPPLEAATVDQALGGAGEEAPTNDAMPASELWHGTSEFNDQELRFMLGEMSEVQVSHVRHGVLRLNDVDDDHLVLDRAQRLLPSHMIANFDWGD